MYKKITKFQYNKILQIPTRVINKIDDFIDSVNIIRCVSKYIFGG